MLVDPKFLISLHPTFYHVSQMGPSRLISLMRSPFNNRKQVPHGTQLYSHDKSKLGPRWITCGPDGSQMNHLGSTWFIWVLCLTAHMGPRWICILHNKSHLGQIVHLGTRWFIWDPDGSSGLHLGPLFWVHILTHVKPICPYGAQMGSTVQMEYWSHVGI